ncbi:MAG: HAD hydrolase family protein [candidate division NC10 bacterium]|nr:HAD hydrolase family protein [candidate division NC10 bacterium]MBI4842094.1 HAD hydrolase family protein [candidate division NC10 bacterium]
MPVPQAGPVPRGVLRRAKAIKLLVLDVDGILTDGRLVYGPGGHEFTAFHILDGHGIRLALRFGLSLALITGRESEAVAQRARELGILEVHQKALDKLSVFQDLLARRGLTASQVACMGDDLVDLPLLRRAGLAITVPDAVEEIRAAAQYVTSRPGGQGAVREAIELLLKAQAHWPAVMERYQR